MSVKEDAVEIFSRLVDIRREFREMGFGVPQLVLARIESVRARSPDEKDYAFYSIERLLESISFPYGRWRRSQRNAAELVYRSKYIDWLCNAFGSVADVFGSDNNDSPTTYQEALERDADPNKLLYGRLQMLDDTASRAAASSAGHQLAREVKLFGPQIDSMSEQGGCTSTKKVMTLFAFAAEQAGIAVRTPRFGRRPRVVLEGRLTADCSLYADWDDDLALRKWGRLDIGFFLGSPDTPMDGKSSNFRCDLEALIPGGEWYTRTEGDLHRTSLGILAHVQLMKLMVKMAR